MASRSLAHSDVARDVVVLDQRWAHHSPHSGYGRFVQTIPGLAAIPCVRRGAVSVKIRSTPRGETASICFGSRALEVPTLAHVIRGAGLTPWWARSLTTGYEYPVHVLRAEVRVLARMRWSRRTVYHLTSAEDQFGLFAKFGWPDRCKVVATFHQPPAVLRALFRDDEALRRLDAAIAVSTNQLDALHELFEPSRVFLVPHGVDTSYWNPGPGPCPGGRRTVVSVGQWLRDWDTLQAVVRDLRRAHGDGLEIVAVTSAEHAGRPARWPGIRVLTGISETELREWYRVADLTLLPLTDGTANNAMLESLACGTPVVATNVGAVRDLKPDGLGLLAVPAHDASAMTRAALSILEGVDDGERALSARRYAEQLDWSRVSQDLLDAYRRVARRQ